MKHDGDVQNAVAYPLRPFQGKTRRRKCRVCELYPAVYVTYGDKLASENPFFWCEECYRPMHYRADGTLLYDDFQVYEYGQLAPPVVVLISCHCRPRVSAVVWLEPFVTCDRVVHVM